MKQKHTITIADVQMNIVTEESPETVEAIVGILDRRIREIYLQSGNHCTRNEAALLCALDYCAEKNKLMETVKALEEKMQSDDTDALRAEIGKLREENANLRAELAVSEEKARGAGANAEVTAEQARILTQKAADAQTRADALAAKVADLEAKLGGAETTVEEPDKKPVAEIAENAEEPQQIELKPLRGAPVDENQLTIDDMDKPATEPAEEPADLATPETMEKEKQKAQKRVRSMFDLITFDNV